MHGTIILSSSNFERSFSLFSPIGASEHAEKHKNVHDEGIHFERFEFSTDQLQRGDSLLR